MTSLELRSPLDMHLHLREGEMLRMVAPLSAGHFAGAVIMPNLVPPVDNLERLFAYRDEIGAAVDGGFAPWMTLFFREYSEAELEAARPHIIGVKLYPQGATTNSEGGVESLAAAEATMARMEEMGIPLLVHGEDPDAFVMDREAGFLPTYGELAAKFPKLRITMEHITTAAAVDLLDRHENLRATVTVQHLLCTLDDSGGGAAGSAFVLQADPEAPGGPGAAAGGGAGGAAAADVRERFGAASDGPQGVLRLRGRAASRPRWRCRCWRNCSSGTGRWGGCRISCTPARWNVTV